MSILEGKEIEEMKSDPLVEYLTDTLVSARFDTFLEDGTVWCSDSNAALHPGEMAKKIRELLGVST